MSASHGSSARSAVRRAGLCLAIVSAACDAGTDHAGERVRPRVERTTPPRASGPPTSGTPGNARPGAGSADPLAGIDDPVGPTEIVAPSPPGPLSEETMRAALPASGCVRLDAGPVRLWNGAGPIEAKAAGSYVYVAGIASVDANQELWVVRVSLEKAPVPMYRERLERPVRGHIVGPALAPGSAGRLAVAFVTADGAIAWRVLEPGSPRNPRASAAIGTSADTRFPLALRALGSQWLLAWTDGSRTSLRVRLARLGPDGGVMQQADVTPTAMTAAAPVFLDGALYLIDPRDGVSTLWRVPLDADGRPADPVVAHAVGAVPAPTRLAAARAGNAVWLAYVAMGSLGTTAIGLVRDAGRDVPRPLVRGTGYGRLTVSAASGERAAVFAAEVPRGPEPDAPREVHLRVVDARGQLGEPLVVRGPDGSARAVAIARRADGVLLVAFESAGAIHGAFARCDD
ncbi:MAG: hypothetical protein NZ898_07580 [Myxococcota bacterium]|nr:hypothetical protein [Myxococcota bacterium]